MRTRVGRHVVLAAVLFALPAATGAAEGRNPLFAPGPITASGKYVLTRNIAGTGAAPAISVQAPQVEIDLNGFTVTNGNGDDCIQVLSSTARLTVRNGTISDCHSAVYAGAATQVVVEDVTVSGTWGGAVNVNDVGSVAIRRATVLGSGSYGIGIVSPTGFSHNALIEDCTVQGTASDGIIFNFGSVQIRNNRVTAAGNTGIRVFEATGSEVSGNLVVGAANDAGLVLVATHGSIVSGNIVRNSYLHGIWLPADATHNLVRDNVSTGNGTSGTGHGLYVQGFANKIEGNTLNANVGAGLFFATTGCRNTIGRNMAQSNNGTGVSGCTSLFAPDSCSQCTGPANGSFGDNLIPGPPVF